MTIVPARPGSLAAINDLIVRSKSYWHWPADYLKRALPLHEIDAPYLESNQCFEILDAGGQLAAWVEPDLIGKGVGSSACEHVVRLARARGWTTLWVIPDPPAAAFYEARGFADTGERVPSRVPGGPVFAVYRIDLESGTR